MGLSCTVSEIKSNSCKIIPPRVINAAVEGVPLGFCNGVGAPETRMMTLPDHQKYDDMSIRLDTYRN